MNTEDLKFIAEYSAGVCLCGHGESCAVCDRSEETRKFERLAKQLAREVIKAKKSLKGKK